MKQIAIIILIIFFLSSCSPHNDEANQVEHTTYQPSRDEIHMNIETPLPVSENTLEQDQNKGKLTIINEWHNLYYGYFDNEEFLLDIYRENNNLTAFLIKKNEQENEINFTGEIVDNKIVLYAYENGIEVCSIEGVGFGPERDDIEGVYTSLKDNTNIPIILKTLHAVHGPLENRYGNDTKKVEGFVLEIQENIIQENKRSLSKKISYPITVIINGDYKTINTAEEFIHNYDGVIHSKFKETIANAYTKFMFHNWQGIMFGSGSLNVWIDEVRVDENSSLMIIGINN